MATTVSATTVAAKVAIIQGIKILVGSVRFENSPLGNNAHRNNRKSRCMQHHEHDLRIGSRILTRIEFLQAFHRLQSERRRCIVQTQAGWQKNSSPYDPWKDDSSELPGKVY